MTKTVCIIQARLGSTRLPGKALLPLCGKPMIRHVIERVKRAKLLDDVVVAIPDEKDNGALKDTIYKSDVGIYTATKLEDRDLIGRYHEAAKFSQATTIVRVCADNPCIDPNEIDRLIFRYNKNSLGWKVLFSNTHNIQNNGYPDGLGAEIYDFKFMKWMHENVKGVDYREHPHKWAEEQGLVWTIMAPHEIRRPQYKLDVNTERDYRKLTRIYEAVYPQNNDFRAIDIIRWIDGQNDLAEWSVST